MVLDRIFELNKRIFELFAPVSIMIGVVVVVILGSLIYGGETELTVSLSEHPIWVGGVMKHGGMLMLVSLLVEYFRQMAWGKIKERFIHGRELV